MITSSSNFNKKGDNMITTDNTVLLLIDVQGNLALNMYEKDNLFKSLKTIIKGMKILGIPIIWIEQIPEKLGHTIPEIAELLPDIKPIEKYTFSCCDNQQIMDKLNSLGKKNVFLTGIETHVCVYQTGYDLIKSGYNIQVVSDCVSSRTKENKIIGIERIKQIKGSATSNEMLLFELMKTAKHDKFKQIVKIIR